MKGPLWLSGQVLKGPNAISKPLDSPRFLRLCTQDYPDSTLLLGWVTGPISSEGDNAYQWGMVKDMHDLVDKWKISQIIVFSVKAAYARRSIPQLKWLLEMTRASLAIFSEPDDGMSIEDLIFIRQKLPISKVYYDLADDLQKQLDALKLDPYKWDPSVRLLQNNETFRTEEWTVMRSGKKEQVFVGTEAVVIQGGLLITKATYTSTDTVTLYISGRVSFLPAMAPTDSTLENKEKQEPGVEIFMRVTQGARPSAISGIKCFIGSSGKIAISAQSVPGSDSHAEAQWPDMPDCVDFSIQDSGPDKVMLTVSQPADCYMNNGKVLGKKTVMMRTDTITVDSGQVAVRGSSSSHFVAIPHLYVSTTKPS